MKPTRLFVAAGLMAVLGGIVWWSNRQEAAKAGKPAADAPPKILSVAEDKVKQIDIQPRSGDLTVVKKSDAGKWSISAPKTYEADSSSVTSLLGGVSNLSAERVVDDNPTDLPSYGLQPPAVAVTFTTTDGKTNKILVGDDTPAGSNVYAMIDGDKRLFTIASYTKGNLNKTWKDLREKHLLNFDTEKLSRVELDAPGQAPIEFGRTGQMEWQILKPKPMRADGLQVDELLNKVKQVLLDPEVDNQKAATGFASAQAVATVKITDANGAKSIEIRKTKDDTYAKSTGVEGAYKINKDAAEGLAKPLDNYRNKKVFDFGFNDPNRVEIKDGAKAIAVDHANDKWTSSGKTMDSVSIQNLVDKLRDLSADKFAESGFTTSALEVTVVSNDSKRTEKIQIAPSGTAFLARREGDATLYQLTGDVVKDLREAANGVKESAPADDKNKKK